MTIRFRISLTIAALIGAVCVDLTAQPRAVLPVPLPDVFALQVTPLGITQGPDGAMWFTGANVNVIGRIASVFPPSFSSYISVPTPATAAVSIVAGPDGNLWFTESEGNRIGRLNPTTREIVKFNLPIALSRPDVIVTGPDGALWFTEAGSDTRVGRITVDGAISEIPLPPPYGPVHGIALGNGVIWVGRQKTDGAPAALLRIAPQGSVDPITLPEPFSMPYSLTRGADGAMWFTDSSGRLGRLDPNGSIAAFTPAGASTPLFIAAARDGSMWFTDRDQPRVGRLDPSGKFEFFPTPFVLAQGIAAGANDQMWVTLPAAHALAVIDATAPPGLRKARRRLVSPGPPPLTVCSPGIVVRAVDVFDVAVDDTYVYYGQNDALLRAPKDGGPSTVLVRTNGYFVGLMTSDSTHISYGVLQEDTGLGFVSAVPKDGGVPRVIARDVMIPFEIVTDSTYVYFISLGTPTEDGFLPDGRIIRARKDGTETVVLASALTNPRALAVSGTSVFFSDGSAEDDTGTLRRVSINGGPATAIVNDVIVSSIAADSTAVYYAGIDLRTFDRMIWRIAPGGQPSVLVTDVFAQSLRIIGDQLYYVNFADDVTIEAVPLRGGSPRIVKTIGFTYPRFSFDSCSVYYATEEGVERAAQ